jgi:hypothetical protein
MSRPHNEPRPTDEAKAILYGRDNRNPDKKPVNSRDVDAAPTEQPKDKPEDKPAFPDIAWRNAFNVYRRAMDGTTEASDVAHFATFWAAAAATLGRKVWMFSGTNIYTNTYLCFYGPSNDKKTTAQRRIANQNLLPENHGIAILSNSGSVQGMADIVSASKCGVSLMLPEELSTLYIEGHADYSTLLEYFTETFDCPPRWEKPYRSKPVMLDTPTPNIFGCSTPTWFWKHARPDDFAGGFGNRFLYLSGARKDPIPEPERPDAHDITEARNAIQALTALPDTEARWSQEARRVWDDFYKSFEKAERSSLLMEAVKRGPVYVRKLAMVYAAFEGTLPEISLEQLRAAIAVVKYAVTSAEGLIDLRAASGRLQSNAELEKRFLNWLKRRGPAKVRDLQQAMSSYCDSETFNRVLRSLEQSNQIDTWWDTTIASRKKRMVELAP